MDEEGKRFGGNMAELQVHWTGLFKKMVYCFAFQ